MDFNVYDIMKELNTYVSPSGHERKQLKFVKEAVAPYCDDLYFDALGNLIAVVGRNKGEKVMYSAHADTIGFIAYAFDDKGFVKVSNLGGINIKTVAGCRVRFENGIDGILYYEMGEGATTLQTCYVDIGATSKEEAERMINIGSACSVVGDIFLMGENKDMIAGPFLDDRIAVAIQMIAIKELYEEKATLKNEVYFVFSVQEELGIRGSGTAAYGIAPKYGVAIDVCTVSDTPKSGHLSQKLGGGACIKIMDASVFCHESMVAFLRKTAEDNGIKWQSEILFAGGTDAGAIHKARGGVYTGAISIPTRYIHSPNEAALISDCREIINLVKASVKTGFSVEE